MGWGGSSERQGRTAQTTKLVGSLTLGVPLALLFEGRVRSFIYRSLGNLAERSSASASRLRSVRVITWTSGRSRIA